MRFGFKCADGHEDVYEFPVGKAPQAMSCSNHGLYCPRVFDVPYTQEDRRGMAAGKDWSWSLGGRRPQSRSEMRAIEKSQGIEFITKAEAMKDVQTLRSGKNLDEPQKLEKGYLAKEIAKRGIRFDRSLTPPRPLTREESERKLKAERPEWNPAEAKEASPAKSLG
jgi:hypothetical protein